MLILIVFAVIFVVAILAAAYAFGDLESAIIPAIVVSALGTGTITVTLSGTDRALIIGAVVVLVAAIVLAAYLIARSRGRTGTPDG